MSWTCSIKGDLATVKQYVEAELERYINMYGAYGTPDGDAEAQDCRDAKRAVLARIDAVKVDPDQYAPAGYRIDVQAYGSRSSYDGTMSMHVSVSREIIQISGG